MNVETLKRHIKDLNNAVLSSNVQEAANILRILKDVQATEDLLRQTKAGVAISKLRSHADSKVSGLSKEVVTKWKSQVDAGKKKASASANGSANSTAPGTPTSTNATLSAAVPSPVKKPTVITSAATPASTGTLTSSRSPSVVTPTATPTAASERRSSVTGLGGATPTPSSASSDVRTAAKDGIKLGNLNDKIRDKCLEMTYDSLVFDSGALDKFCKMSNAEMASEERRQANDLLNATNLHNSLGAAEQEAETDAFKCGRCKQRKTRYRQAQTRSADEPMTTFVTCTNCGNRWKFS
ncbi:RNA polymerase II elongation factor [Tulasnella sp. 419]|nr:RNA polymerase II elongation factor [Tulasnella sp. 419]